MKNAEYIALTALILISVVLLLSKIPVLDCLPSGEKEDSKSSVTYSPKIIDEIKQNIAKADIYMIRVVGKSMEPAIKDNERCLCLPEDDYKVGDVVAFYDVLGGNVELISHRIIYEDAEVFRTKGDNNNVEDYSEIEKEQVLCTIQETSALKNILKRFING